MNRDTVEPLIAPDGKPYFNLVELADVIEIGGLGVEGLTYEDRKVWTQFLRRLDRIATERAAPEIARRRLEVIGRRN